MNIVNRSLQTCFSPALIPFYNIENNIVVVIDIFRATSAMCYAIENGAKGIIPVPDIAQCLSYKNMGYLLAAERNGQIVEGFEYGNSPVAFTPQVVQGKTIVLTTTNGTKAIKLAKSAQEIVMGSFLNLSALSEWLCSQEANVTLLCAGWKNQYALEDALFAGAVVSKIRKHFEKVCDASLTSEQLFLHSLPDYTTFAKKATHNARLNEICIEKDIDLCLKMDISTLVPILKEGMLIGMQ